MANDAVRFDDQVVSCVVDLWFHDFSMNRTSAPEGSKQRADKEVLEEGLAVRGLAAVGCFRHPDVHLQTLRPASCSDAFLADNTVWHRSTGAGARLAYQTRRRPVHGLARSR